MGFYVGVEDPMIGLTIGQAIYEVALIIAVVRWLLCFVLRVMKDRRTGSADSPGEGSCSSSWERDSKSLALTTFGEIVERVPETEETCAVCLNELKMEDEVRELVNCYHVFHKECIDRWLEYDHHDNNHDPTCPLCRAPCYYLSTSSSSSSSSSSSLPPLPPHPSWPVDSLLYLFGDDLLPC